MPSSNGTLEGEAVPLEQFRALTRMPIVVSYGTTSPPGWPTSPGGQLEGPVRNGQAPADAINRHGGDASLVHLPEIGMTGNMHFAFSDLNNLQIADQMSAFLAQKGLDS
jgi:hypothetical protein